MCSARDGSGKTCVLFSFDVIIIQFWKTRRAFNNCREIAHVRCETRSRTSPRVNKREKQKVPASANNGQSRRAAQIFRDFRRDLPQALGASNFSSLHGELKKNRRISRSAYRVCLRIRSTCLRKQREIKNCKRQEIKKSRAIKLRIYTRTTTFRSRINFRQILNSKKKKKELLAAAFYSNESLANLHSLHLRSYFNCSIADLLC